MNDQPETIVITRGAISQWASFIGMTSLLLGALGWLWIGELNTIVGLFLAVGVGGIVLWAIMTPQEFVGFFTGRQIRYGTVSVLSTLLMIGIVVLTYILMDRAVITLDMTERGAFTLSRETLNVLEAIDQPVRITGFYSPRLAQQQEIDDQFFRLYETATNGLISREYIDPNEQPTITETFLAEDGWVYISYVNPDGTTDLNTLYRVPLSGTQERDMTIAILRLLNVGSTIIYFDESLDELSPLDGGARGISSMALLLQQNGIATLPLNIEALAASGEEIPRNADAIILARPAKEPSESAIRLIDAYLRDGGGLLILADTQTDFMTEGSPFNNYMWENWGLRMGSGVVVEDMLSGETNLDAISFAVTDSEITAGINPDTDPASSVQFRIARPVEVDESPPVPNGRLIQTSPGSYAEQSVDPLFRRNEYGYDEGVDILGPLTTAAFAEDTDNTGARIVLVGDSDFITNGQIIAPEGNSLLVANSLAWMSGFGENVSIAPQTRVTGIPLVFVSAQQLDTVAFVTVIVMPGIALALSILVWVRRNRR